MTTASLRRAIVVSLAACLGVGSGAGAQQIPAGYEQGIFQLSIPDLPRTAIPVLLAPDGALLFPLAPILSQGEIPFSAHASGYSVSLVDADLRALDAGVDTIARRVSRAAAAIVAGPGEMMNVEGDVYLSIRLLAHLLGAEVRADFATLDLHVDPDVPVPAQLALEAARRRQLAMIRAGVAGGRPLPPTPLRPRTGAGVLHYSLSSAAPDSRSATVLTLESGFALLGGLGVVGYTASDGGVVADPQLTFRYERFIPERGWISFVRAGDVFAEGAFFRSMRGLTVTNRPLRREGFFQDLLIDPEVPPGYEIEVYQGGQLIAYSDRTTQDPIRVALSYGRTDLEVRMIAPSGEIVSTELLYGVPQSQLPEGAVEYSAGGGLCHFVECELYFASVDHGVRRWLTVGTGYEAQHDTTGFEHLPFARATFAPVGGWLGEMRFVLDRQLSGSAQYTGTGPLTGLFAVDVRTAAVPRATVLPQSETRWDARGEVGYRRHRALGRLGGLEGAGIDRWGLGYIAGIPRGILITQVESFDSSAELSVAGFRLLRRRLLGTPLTVSGRISAAGSGLRAIEMGTSGSWGNAFFANATVGWDREAELNLALSFSRIFPAGQVAGVVSAASGHARASLRADGALAIDPGRAIEPAVYTGIGFAGIDAFVFRDANSNGVRDEGERPAVGVTVQAGERAATSDSSGHARLWGILPWEKTTVRISPDWLEPQWAPATPERVIRPVAHMFNPIEVALVATREFVAYVVPVGIATSSSIGFRLVNQNTGRVWQGQTMTDGSIYVSGVPVGNYVLELDPEALAFLRARVRGAPIRFTIGMDGADEFVFELPPIELHPNGVD